MVARFLLVACLLLAALLPHSASGETPQLLADSFSFFFFEGAEVGATVPTPAPVDIQVAPSGQDVWTISILENELSLPPITYPSGKSVEWRLSAPATGTLDATGAAVSVTLIAPLEAYVDGATEPIPFPLSFTSGSVSATADGETASRTGLPLDPASGYMQLVAAAVNPEHAATAPGKPFVAVLSGRLLGLPAEIQ